MDKLLFFLLSIVFFIMEQEFLKPEDIIGFRAVLIFAGFIVALYFIYFEFLRGKKKYDEKTLKFYKKGFYAIFAVFVLSKILSLDSTILFFKGFININAIQVRYTMYGFILFYCIWLVCRYYFLDEIYKKKFLDIYTFEKKKVIFNNIAKGILSLYVLLTLYLTFTKGLFFFFISPMALFFCVQFFVFPKLRKLIKDRFKYLGYDFDELKKEVEVEGSFYHFVFVINKDIIKDEQVDYYITYLWLLNPILTTFIFVLIFMIFFVIGLLF